MSLKYNVHKNLGECYLQQGEVSLAQQEMLAATLLDDGDVTLWFKIAGSFSEQEIKFQRLYSKKYKIEGIRVLGKFSQRMGRGFNVIYQF